MNADPEVSAAASKRMSSQNLDSDFHKRKVAGLRGKWEDKDYAKRFVDRATDRINRFNANPDFKSASRARMQANHRDRDFTGRFYAAASARQKDPAYQRVCPHCGAGPLHVGNFTRWHGDNCKQALAYRLGDPT